MKDPLNPEIVVNVPVHYGVANGPSGSAFPGLFAMASRQHAARYGTTRRHLSSVVVKNKGNGLKNPLAQMGRDVSFEMVEQSAPIADPLLLYDCCPTSDGAAALGLMAEGRAGVRPGRIDVKATVQPRGAARLAGHPDLCSFEATVEAARQA